MIASGPNTEIMGDISRRTVYLEREKEIEQNWLKKEKNTQQEVQEERNKVEKIKNSELIKNIATNRSAAQVRPGGLTNFLAQIFLPDEQTKI